MLPVSINGPALALGALATAALAVAALRAARFARRCRPRVARLIAGGGPRLRGPGDVFAWLGAEMAGLVQEQLRVILLDARAHVLGVHLVYQGGRAAIAIALCDIYREAVRVGASSIVLVHNHPARGGLDTPGADDWTLTLDAGRAGELLDIALADHVIIGRDERGRPGYLSLARLTRDRGGAGGASEAVPFWAHPPALPRAA